jgi:hypothetical protein
LSEGGCKGVIRALFFWRCGEAIDKANRATAYPSHPSNTPAWHHFLKFHIKCWGHFLCKSSSR